MTTIRRAQITCGACSRRFVALEVDVTQCHGSPDLDSRPPDLQRSTMTLWVRRCPYCQACAADLARWSPALTAALNRPGYRHQLESAAFPAKANEFLCWQQLARAGGDWRAAAWAALFAAWVCDDLQNDAAARHCRGLAVAGMDRAERAGLPLFSAAGGQQGLRVDLLRRSGRYTEARAALRQSLESAGSRMLQRVLTFQGERIEAGDVAPYTVAAALGDDALPATCAD